MKFLFKENAVIDYQIKIVFLGNACVGKTSIIEYEIENKFLENIESTSIVQYFLKNYTSPDVGYGRG